MFDEQVFPFSTLHPNAGARFQAEINLLREHLQNPSTVYEDASTDSHACSLANTNDLTSGGRVV